MPTTSSCEEPAGSDVPTSPCLSAAASTASAAAAGPSPLAAGALLALAVLGLTASPRNSVMASYWTWMWECKKAEQG